MPELHMRQVDQETRPVCRRLLHLAPKRQRARGPAPLRRGALAANGDAPLSGILALGRLRAKH